MAITPNSAQPLRSSDSRATRADFTISRVAVPLTTTSTGCVEQDRQAGIQVEVERRRRAREVGALADDHVAAALELAKGGHHALLDLVEDAARDRRLALVV